MLSPLQLLTAAKCGKYSYMCCLSRDQFVELAIVTRGMSTSELTNMYEVICACTVPGAGGLQDNGARPLTPGQRSVCTQKFVDSMCTDSITTLLVIVDNAVSAVLVLGAAALPPPLRIALMELSVLTEMWKQACTAEGFTEEIIKGMCKVLRDVGSAIPLIPDAAASTLKPLLDFVGLESVTRFVSECCNAPEIIAAAMPPWAADVDAFRRAPSGGIVPAFWVHLPPETILTSTPA